MSKSIVQKLRNFFVSHFSANTSHIGLSIGSSSIKLVELKKTSGQWKLLHFGIVQLPEDAIVNREIVDAIAVSEGLKTLVSQIKLGQRKVATGLSGSSVVVKKIQIEVENPKDIRDQVLWEAEQYLPFDLSEMVIDYYPLSKVKSGLTEIVLVGVKKQILETYMSCIVDAGLEASVVDLDLFSLQCVLESNYPVQPTESVLLLDIGASSLKLIVTHQGRPLLSRDVAIGGRNLTAEIQRQLQLSFYDAEVLKTSSNPAEIPQEVSELMQIMTKNFLDEIKKTIEMYQSSSSGPPIAYALVSGGSSKIPNLLKTFEDDLRIPFQLVNPFNSISYDPQIFTQEYLQAVAPFATIPIGLAMRSGAK